MKDTVENEGKNTTLKSTCIGIGTRKKIPNINKKEKKKPDKRNGNTEEKRH